MQLWTAFLLGLLGSLHCAGMCGPLALAMPVNGRSRISFITGRAAYNVGRLATYCSLGLLFGLFGRTMAMAGVQRWVSIGAGVAIWTALLFSSRLSLSHLATGAVTSVKRGFSKLLKQKNFSSLLLLGALNGLLPCGLVYGACAGALVSTGLAAGATYMLAFGAGTLPMMMAIGLAGQRLQFVLRFRFARLIPVGLGLVGTLLILHGLSLGIPYVSPTLSSSGGVACVCH